MSAEREELADLLADARDAYPRRPDDMDSGELADAILASDWLAARDRRVAAEALRSAADDMEALFRSGKLLGGPTDDWLRARADATDPLEPGLQPGARAPLPGAGVHPRASAPGSSERATYGMCTACGAIEAELVKPTGTRDLSAIGEHHAYPTGYGCEFCA